MSKKPPLQRSQKPESIKNELRSEFRDYLNYYLGDYLDQDNFSEGFEGDDGEPISGNLLDLYFRKDAEDKDSEYIPAIDPNTEEVLSFGRLTQPDGQGKIFVNVPAKIISEISQIDYWTVRLSGQEPFRTEKAFFVFKGLNPNKTYRAVVRGFDSDGKELGKSQPITFKTIPKQNNPNNPINLDVNFGGQDLVVRWTYDNPESDFKVFRIRYTDMREGANEPYIETEISGRKNVFTFDENKKYFGIPGPSPKIRVNVKARDTSGNESEGIFTIAENLAPTTAPTVASKGTGKSNANGYTIEINSQNAPRDLQKIQIYEWPSSTGGTPTLVKTINRKKIDDTDDITETQITKRGDWSTVWVSARYVDVFNQAGSHSSRAQIINNWDAGSSTSSINYDGSTLMLNNTQLLVGDLVKKNYISINYQNNNRILGVNGGRLKFVLNANTGNASFSGKVKQGARLGKSNVRFTEQFTQPGPTGITGTYTAGTNQITISNNPLISDPDTGLLIPQIEEGMLIKGDGIPELTRIDDIQVNLSNQTILTVNKNVTATRTNTALTFPRDQFDGLNINDRIVITDSSGTNASTSAGILFYGKTSFNNSVLPRTKGKNTLGDAGDIELFPIIGEIFDASESSTSFIVDQDNNVTGYGIALGFRDSYPQVEVGKVVNSTNDGTLNRIRLMSSSTTLPSGHVGPVLTIGIGASSQSFRLFGGNESKIDGFENATSTTGAKLLGKNDQGYLRWYEPGTGGGTGITVFELGSAADTNLLQLATITGGYRLGLDSQSANRIFAGPSTGVDDMPTFRSLVIADLPSGVPNSIIGSNGTSVTFSNRQYTVEGRTYSSGDNDAGISINNTNNTIQNTGYRLQGTTAGGWQATRTAARNRITYGTTLPDTNLNDGDIHIEF